jgi:DNA-directed RNA polymerase beta subunit
MNDLEEFSWKDETWKDVIDPYFKGDKTKLVAHQLESFNNFIESAIPSLMQHMLIKVTDKKSEMDNAGNEHTFRILSCGISKPIIYQNGRGFLQMLPSEARYRNLTYAAHLYIDFEYMHRQGSEVQTIVQNKVCIGKIPIMVGSKYCHLYGRSDNEKVALNECPYDKGGYFIIKGSEKVIISQERPVENTISCFEEPDQSKPYECRSEVKSTIDQRFFPIKVAIVKLTKYQDPAKTAVPGHKLVVSLPYGRRPIPLFVIFKAFGVLTDKDILSYLYDVNSEVVDQDYINLLLPSAYETSDVFTQADAIRYVANSININIADKKVQDVQNSGKMDNFTDELESASNKFRMEYAKDLLNREFLPHVGNDPTKKLRFLSLMVQRLLNAKLKRTLFSDRDNLINKRLDLPGTLIFQIFRNYFQKMLKDVKTIFIKATDVNATVQDIKKTIQKSNIYNKLCYALSTGNWYTNRSQASSAAKKGVAQVLQRLAYLGTISHLRRITSPLERAGSKHEPPRRYHGTQPPKICPAETPEGAQVGSVKNLSLMTHVSIETSSYPVLFCLKKLGMIMIEEASSSDVHRKSKIIINGDLVGVSPSLQETIRYVTILRYLRRTGSLNKYISITWDQDLDIIKVLTDGGRYSTPYYIIDADGHFQLDNFKKYHDGTLPSFDSMTESLPDDALGELPYNENYRNDDYKSWKQAGIEYLDTDEEGTTMIALRPEQLFDFQTMRVKDGHYVGHLTTTVKLALSDAEFAKVADKKKNRELIRTLSPVEDTDAEGLERQKNQDLLDVEQEQYQTQPLKERIMHYLEDNVKSIFSDCVSDVILLDGADHQRTIKIVPSRELTTKDVHVLTNLNRFITRTYVRYTHCVLHAAAIIHGVVAGNIPFPDHNQSPRNCYQSSMGKQAIGPYVKNYSDRMDTMGNILVYSQVPLVSTRIAKYTQLDKLHHGYNAMIAIACYSGYNQEDSLVGSLASVQRGAYNTAYYRTYSATLQKLPSQDASEHFEVPPERTIGRKIGSGGNDRYHAIVRNFGAKSTSRKPELPKVGAIVTGNDIIIPKCKKGSSKKKSGGTAEVLYTDCSVTIKPSEGGVVDMVIPNEYITNNDDEDAYQFVKVRICEKRQPEIGDKFASRAAQKGTVSVQLNSADLLFNQLGISPDLVMNAHAIPTRMTQGQLIESACSKEGALTGNFRDATPFTDFDMDEIKDLLGQTGYDRNGDEIMYNGQTGEPLESPIVFWPTYYQRLKHMVGDKMHARGLGPIQALTKQPAEGRSRMGGLRLGEMERDCLIAHGVAIFLKEKLMEASDIFEVHVSEQAKTVIAANPKTGVYQNGTEEIYGKDDISKVHMPYAMNLFRNELRTMLVDVQLIV